MRWEGVYTHWCCPFDAQTMSYSEDIWRQTLQHLENQGVKWGRDTRR